MVSDRGAVPYLRETCPDAVITHLEASDAMLEIARSRYPNEVFLRTDLHDLPQETESQDVVVSLETLEHVPDPLHFLLECHRVLKVGGRLILSAPPAWSEVFLCVYERFFDNHGEGPHRFPSVRSVLQALKSCGFSVITHRGTVLLPVGPEWAKRSAEWMQQNAPPAHRRQPAWHPALLHCGKDPLAGPCLGQARGGSHQAWVVQPVRNLRGPFRWQACV